MSYYCLISERRPRKIHLNDLMWGGLAEHDPLHTSLHGLGDVGVATAGGSTVGRQSHQVGATFERTKEKIATSRTSLL